ncbi:MAG: penicillin-binding protein 2 [Fusobacteriota bacterium]
MKINIKINKSKTVKDRMNIIIVLVIIAYSVIGIRLFYLQVYKGEYYKNMAENNRVKIKRLEPPRGKIYDRNGELLATNVAGYRLVYLEGKNIESHRVEELANFLERSKSEVDDLIKNGEIIEYTRENIIIDDILQSKAHKIMEKLDSYPYLKIDIYLKRKYLYNEIASHIIGYVKRISGEEWGNLKEKGYTNTDYIGKKGIEKEYEDLLQGKPGYEYIEVNALNKTVKQISNKRAKLGKDLTLSLDIKLQQKITEFIGDKEASFIAMDIKTGELIVAISSPEYNLNKLSSKISQSDWLDIVGDKRRPLQNKITSSGYPPGSIFKPIVALAFLDEGIDPKEEVYDKGYFNIGKWRWHNWREYGKGYVDMEEAIYDSNNIYFYTMADKIGNKPIENMAKKFGIGQKTGIDIPNEKTGILPTDSWKRSEMGESWYRGDTINFSIGQGYLSVTPLQMAKAYALIGGEGKTYIPHLIKGKKVSEIQIDVPVNEIQIIKSFLRKTVEEGTAKIIDLDQVQPAAKTGSAENNQYEDTHAWLAGYFPYDDPEIAFLSLVEGGGHGGSGAGPIVKEFLKEYVNRRK